MDSLLLFQRLPRNLRRHKLLRVFACLGGGGVIQRVRVNSSFEAFIDIRDGFARLIPIEDRFEDEFFALAAALMNRPDQVFFDVGANYGLMSFGLGKTCGNGFQAHLFEANPYLSGIIKKSAAINGEDHFRVVNAAVMDSDADVYLSFDIAHTGAGFVSKMATGEKVKAITLDQYIETSGIERVNLLKIDVEGNESSVLLGAARSLQSGVIEAVYFEYCPAHQKRADSGADPIEILNRSGFEVFYFQANDIAQVGGATHFIGTVGMPVPLTEARLPLRTSITDLIALRRGVAAKS